MLFWELRNSYCKAIFPLKWQSYIIDGKTLFWNRSQDFCNSNADIGSWVQVKSAPI